MVLRGRQVVGYYSLAAGAVRRDDTPQAVTRGLGNYPIPVILLARLAVDRQEQARGLGATLLKDALLRCLAAAEFIGTRAVLMHAKDPSAAAFYRRYGFEHWPIDALHLYLLIKDIQASVTPDQA